MMFTLSTKGRYGLRAMIELSVRNSDGPVLLREIANAQDIPIKYMEQIFIALRRAGYVAGARGSKGGYYLVKPASEVNLYELLSCLEGRMTPVACVGNKPCARQLECETRPLWVGLHDVIKGYLSSFTLKDMIEKRQGDVVKQAAETLTSPSVPL